MGFEEFDEDHVKAEKLQSVFREFVSSFLHGQKKNAGNTCEKLLRNEVSEFKGGTVGKKPEKFTQETIIEGVLDALGYDTTHDPVKLVKDEKKQPDIELGGVGDEHVGIVECKALLRERNSGHALDSLEERYLDTNAFAHYKTNQEMQYVVGIATDGFDWKLRVKDIKRGEILPEFEANYSLVDDSDGIHHCYYAARYDEAKTHWPAIREELAENFVSNFGSHNLPGDA